MSATGDQSLPVLWRTKLRSELEGIVHAEQVAYCLKRKIVGTGWGLDELPSGTPLQTVIQTIESKKEPRWGRTTAQMVRRFGEAAQIGDFVWTRDTFGRYLLGRIAGPYRYDPSAAARAVDLYHVRPVTWAPRPLNDLEVPGAVVNSFVGRGSSWSRIHNESARRLTPYLWQKLRGKRTPKLKLTANDVLMSCLDPYDVEDLVHVWLQRARGYLALPRTRQPATPAYEWTMIHRQTRRRAIVQVKTGSEPVDLQALRNAVVDDETDTYAFATCGRYVGDRGLVSEIIGEDDLLALVRTEPSLLPSRVRTWFQLAGD